MKKLLVLLLFVIISATLWSQNEYKYPVYAGGLKVGEKDRWPDLSQIDSMNVVGGEFIIYVGAAEYTVEGGGGTTYTNATPTPEDIGGIESGSTFSSQTMTEMWDALLYPYQYPAFTSFSISGQSTTLECGVEIAAGVKTWNWGTSNPANVAANSIDIDDITDATNLITGTANDGTEDVSIGASPITKTTTATQHRWRITGENSQTDNFTRDFVVTWYSPFYYGSGGQGLTVSQIQALTKEVVATGTKVYTFNPSTEVMYIAYPASYGTLSSILDPNGFETIADWTLKVDSFTNNPPDYEGTTVTYNIYEFDNPTTQTDFEITFIF